MTQLAALSKPFAPRLIKEAPKGKYGDYVAHSAVTEKLLAVLGPFSFEVGEVVRDSENHHITAALCTLTCEVDERTVTITEVGHNDGHATDDGARLKNAASDGIKRCAMRIGVGLHLWSQGDFFLHGYLTEQEADGAE